MPYRIRDPHWTFVRQSLRLLGRTFIPLLADIRITGKENFPKQGPLIVVGNHTAIMEEVLMCIYTAWVIEFMGSIDIPHEKFNAFIIDLYGYLPIFRGKASPSSLKTGLEALKQDGVLGIFPGGDLGAGRPTPGEIVTATQSILNHLEQENPYYFTYRYGQREGKAMEAGVREGYNLALWARESQFSLRLLPLRRFKDLATGQEVVLDRPEEFDKL